METSRPTLGAMRARLYRDVSSSRKSSGVERIRTRIKARIEDFPQKRPLAMVSRVRWDRRFGSKDIFSAFHFGFRFSNRKAGREARGGRTQSLLSSSAPFLVARTKTKGAKDSLMTIRKSRRGDNKQR